MPKITPIRNSFNGGELSPKIDYRGDVDKYHSGCITMENMVPMVEGGATRMPGTYFVAETKDSSKKSRVIPFRYSTEQAYVIEVGDQYLRFYKDQARIEVADVPVEVVTAFLEVDIFGLKYTQSADVLYWFNQNYPPGKLSRLSHTDWTFATIPFRPPPTSEKGHVLSATLTPGATTGTGITFTASAGVFITGDVGRLITSGASRVSIVSYTSSTVVVCDILDDFPDTNPIASGDWTLLNSPSGYISPSHTKVGQICTITGDSVSGTPVDLLSAANDYWQLSGLGGYNEYFLTSAAPPYSAIKPDNVLIEGEVITEGVIASLGISQWAWGVGIGDETIFIRMPDSSDPDSNAPPDGFVQRADGAPTALFRPSDLGKYLFLNGGFIKITEVISSSSVKGEVVQDLASSASTDIWSIEEDSWNATDGYPLVGVFFEQRLVVSGASTASKSSQTVNLSVSGDYENFARDPDADDAAIEFALVSNQVEGIHWFAGTDYLMIGTMGGLWKFGATNSNEPLSQANVTAKKQGGSGTKNIPALPVTESIMWVDLSGRSINRLDYSFEAEKYISTNMSRVASHITRGSTKAGSGIVDMAFQSAPFPIVWSVRADGQLLGMTYETQEDIYAWFRVVTDGEFESVATITNGDEEDEIWVVVKRTINGVVVRNIEFFKPFELFSKIEDSFFVHSGVTYDGGDAVTITGITQANPAVVRAVNTFVAGDKVRIKDVEGMTQVNLGLTKAWTVANPTGTTFELSGIDSTIWDAYSSGGSAQAVKKDFTSGLNHLIGESVDILTDGAVHPQAVVSATGALSLGWYGNLIHVGLPAPAILEPTKPYINMAQGPSRGKKQRINKVNISFYETYGCRIGPDTDNLKPVKFGDGTTPSLFTGEIQQPFDGSWGPDASFVMYQSLPLPMTVRAIIYGMSINES